MGLVPVLQEGDVPQQQRHPHHQHPVLELETNPREVLTLAGEGPLLNDAKIITDTQFG